MSPPWGAQSEVRRHGNVTVFVAVPVRDPSNNRFAAPPSTGARSAGMGGEVISAELAQTHDVGRVADRRMKLRPSIVKDTVRRGSQLHGSASRANSTEPPR
jgi:hypothetical protein